METKDCINNKEIKDLNQLLKNIEEALVERLKKAKGEINTKILIKIYLMEYTITKFKIPKEINDFRIPSKEKTSRESPLIEITELSFCISLENVIGEWYKFSPICLIESDISEFKLIIWSHRKNEKFIQIPKTINLKINFEGFSTDVTPKWEKSNLKP